MEMTRTREREQVTIGSGGPNTDADGGTLITLSSWPYCEQIPAGGMTVGEIRRRYAERMDLDPLSQATIDGHEADNETVIAAGQVLMFVRRAGEKG